MRIAGGTLKGRMIALPAKYEAKPTTDFAKEGLFNILSNDVDFDSVSFLDLFSGTGSISFEFASRGCHDIVSVEMNPANAAAIKNNVSSLGISGMQVVRHNVFDFLGICHKSFDIIFADPPYSIDGLAQLPEKVFGAKILAENGTFILEHPSAVSFNSAPHFIKERKYGNVHFSFFKNQE